MKKIIMFIIALLVSAGLTIILFEMMSWYHLGDIPTRVVLIRLIAFFCIISGITIGIVSLFTRKN